VSVHAVGDRDPVQTEPKYVVVGLLGSLDDLLQSSRMWRFARPR